MTFRIIVTPSAIAMLKAVPEGFVPTDTVAVMQIVHRRERSSSAVVGFIRSIGVESGAVVRLVQKMPS